MRERKTEVTCTWKVYGLNGKPQGASFEDSARYNFSDEHDGTRIIELVCADKTGTNDYVVVKITRDTVDDCIDEFYGQLSDGIFENYGYGETELLKTVERRVVSDGWYTVSGYNVHIENGHIDRGLSADKQRTTYVFRSNRKGGYDREDSITVEAFRSGVRRGTIKMM